MTEIDAVLSEKAALSCNILAMSGHSNLTMGHVTVRNQGQDFLHMNAHDLGLEEITPKDIIIIDFEGNKLVGSGRKHSEFPIHTEIYKMYPHINCVIHTHPFYSLILGATADTIQTLSHEGSLFDGIPIFTETALLIRSAELGEAIAQRLDGHRAILLRNHGVVVAGTSVEEATVFAVLLERAAKLQVLASQVGSFHSCSSADTAGKGEQVFYSKNIKEFWDYFIRILNKSKPAG